MELRKLKASFGRLEGAELELHSGLNVIEAPNESGKSTWAAFLRAMLYGVSTSDRVRSGVLPDRMRYQPWSGAPMAGQAELLWHGRDITLRRTSPGGGKPMGNAEAVYTGTEERVPELRAGVPGEVILGVPEAVFRYWFENSAVLETLVQIHRTDILYSSLRRTAEDHPLFQAVKEDDAQYDYFVSIVTSGMVGILTTWVEHGKTESGDEVLQRFVGAMGTLVEMLFAG